MLLRTSVRSNRAGRILTIVLLVDQAMVNKIFSALVSFLVTVVPIILALHQPGVDVDGALSEMSCGLSEAQEAGLLAWYALGGNASCIYNVTISSVVTVY